MGKSFEFVGFDEYLAKLNELQANTTSLVKRAVYDGAAFVANEVRASIEALPSTDRNPPKGESLGVLDYEKEGLLEGLGLSGMKNDDGFIYTHVGFEGYNRLKSKKYPKGHPNSMIARSIESGSSVRAKHPFMRKALQNAKAKAINAMAARLDEDISNIV
jgi:HK97 gp10 family phage protein